MTADEIVAAWGRGEITFNEACARMRALPDWPEPVLDVDAFGTRLEVLERYDELRDTVARFWVVEEGAGRIAECEGAGGSFIVRHFHDTPRRYEESER